MKKIPFLIIGQSWSDILLFTLKLQPWMDFTFSKATHKGQNKQKSCYHVCGCMSTMLMSRIFSSFIFSVLCLCSINSCLQQSGLKNLKLCRLVFHWANFFLILICAPHMKFIGFIVCSALGSKVGSGFL